MRALLFWGVCIPLRLYLATYGAFGRINFLRINFLRAAALVVSYRWLSGAENSKVGFFGGKVWWAKERPLHGLLWGMYALSGRPVFLYLDTAFGALNWFENRI